MYLIARYLDGEFHDWVRTGKSQLVIHENITSAKKSRSYHERSLPSADFRIINVIVGEEVITEE